MSIVVHAANMDTARIACATLGKVARVHFDDEVTGYIDFMQPSLQDDTIVTVALQGLDFQPNPYVLAKHLFMDKLFLICALQMACARIPCC